MKTQHNNQKTASQVSKMVLYSAVIFSVALISKTASAQNFWKQFSNSTSYGKMASQVVDQSSETEKTDAVFEIINAEVSTPVNNSIESNFTTLPEFSKVEETLEYNPKKFVEEEMATEKENLMNSEAVIIEGSLEYNPQKFVEAEMEIEKENLMNSEIEAINEAVEAESEVHIEILTNQSQYDAEKFVKHEMASEIENIKTNEEFLESAESLTINGTEEEVAKYAQKVINATEKEHTLEVEDGLTNENLFKAAEVVTANGSEQEIGKYAQKVIAQNQMLIASN